MELWELLAREAIRDLVARYNASGDSGRFDELMSLFTPDAALEVLPEKIYRGRREIRSLFTLASRERGEKDERGEKGEGEKRGMSQGIPRLLRHFTATLQIDVDDALRAHGRCYYMVLTEAGLDHWGRYLDQYQCLDGRWLFASRRVTVDARVPGGWGERALSRLERGS